MLILNFSPFTFQLDEFTFQNETFTFRSVGFICQNHIFTFQFIKLAIQTMNLSRLRSNQLDKVPNSALPTTSDG